MYTKKDTNYMSWDEFGSILERLGEKLIKYQENNNIKFDLIVPILRSGGIPATVLANKLNIIHTLPVQFKYSNGKNNQILSLSTILDRDKDFLNILICETNTVTGKTAQKAVNLISKNFPKSKIFYSTITKVFGINNDINGVEEIFYGIETNESFLASENEIKEFGLRDKITIFPWESIENELLAING